ncbi:dethiobiotin synthase [bacterium]|nr:dethiobiotin synthase [bacterium]
MSKNVFITATGTDIGKTYISALIVKKMREVGLNCGYFKPVLSGVVEQNGKLIESDCNYVVNTAKIPVEADDCVAYWWKEAVSPHLAAKRAGEDINIEKIKENFAEKQKKYDYLLIEGAGGITCPLRLENGEKYLLKDLIKELSAKIIIVADGGLGTINSIILTVEYAKLNNITIEGIILNNFNPESFMHQDNLKQVEYLTDVKVIATVKKNQTDIKLLKEYFK